VLSERGLCPSAVTGKEKKTKGVKRKLDVKVEVDEDGEELVHPHSRIAVKVELEKEEAVKIEE
jgi:hypothetical protein